MRDRRTGPTVRPLTIVEIESRLAAVVMEGGVDGERTGVWIEFRRPPPSPGFIPNSPVSFKAADSTRDMRIFHEIPAFTVWAGSTGEFQSTATRVVRSVARVCGISCQHACLRVVQR